MRERLLSGIARLCIRRHRRILLLFFVLLGVAFVLTGRLRFDPNFLKLFPSEEGPIKLYMENLKEAGTFDLLFILLEQEEGAEPGRLAESGRTIADALKAIEIDGRKAFQRVRFQKIEAEDLEGVKPAFSLFLTHPYLFLDEKDIPKLMEKWSAEEIDRQVRKNRRTLVSQASFAMKDLIRIDPFEMRWLFMEKWREGMKGMEFEEAGNFFLSRDRKSLLIITEPAQPATDLSFSSSLVEALEKRILPVHSGPPHRLKISITGAHPIATAEARALRFDMQGSFFFSLLLVLILFLYAYRRWITFVFVGLPLFGGIQLTMGIASATLGSLNILTTAFAAILVGLGIDFAVHIYDRYQQERASGSDIPRAIETTLTQTGKAVWTGAFTTIFAFSILFFSRVQGILELAFLVSVGLLCALLCIFFVLPSFLIWIDRRKDPYSYGSLNTFPFRATSSFLKKRPLAILLGFIGVTVFFAFFACRIELERDFRNLRPRQVEALQALDRMIEIFGGRKLEALALHEGKELASLLLAEEKLAKALEQYEKEGKIHSFTSLSAFVPSPEKQRKTARLLRESIDLEKVKTDFIRSLKENGFALPEFQPVIESLEALSRGSEIIHPPEAVIAVLRQGPLKKGIEPFLVQKEEGYRLISHLYYEKGKLSLDQLDRDLPGISITGPERVESEILRIVKEDLFLLTPIAFVIILVWVYFHFRQWRATVFTLLPLTLGLVWMVGSMSLLGIRFNFVNAVILPMIIGMGIDNSIHLMHRFLEGGGRDVGLALRTTGRAMAMCSLTTMLGFGSLVTARYQALSTMGWVTIFGMGFCSIASLTLLPAILILWKRRSGEP